MPWIFFYNHRSAKLLWKFHICHYWACCFHHRYNDHWSECLWSLLYSNKLSCREHYSLNSTTFIWYGNLMNMYLFINRGSDYSASNLSRNYSKKNIVMMSNSATGSNSFISVYHCLHYYFHNRYLYIFWNGFVVAWKVKQWLIFCK